MNPLHPSHSLPWEGQMALPFEQVSEERRVSLIQQFQEDFSALLQLLEPFEVGVEFTGTAHGVVLLDLVRRYFRGRFLVEPCFPRITPEPVEGFDLYREQIRAFYGLDPLEGPVLDDREEYVQALATEAKERGWRALVQASEKGVLIDVAPAFEAQDIELLPMETVIGPGQMVPVMVFTQDDEGYGVMCAADGLEPNIGAQPAFGEYPGTTPCALATNPMDITVDAIQNGNIPGTSSAVLGTLPLVAPPSYVREIYGTGGGYGAYYTEFWADTVGDTKGEIQVSVAGPTPVQVHQRFDIVDADIELELLRDSIVTDEGVHALIYMYDQNDDPLYNMTGVTTVNPASGGNVTIVPSLGVPGLPVRPAAGATLQELYQAASWIGPGPWAGGITTGSGVYAFTLDTVPDINEGEYTVNVSTVWGRVITDTDSFEVVTPEVDLDCHPDFVVTNNTISCL